MGPRISSTFPIADWSCQHCNTLSLLYADLVFEVYGGVEVGDLGVCRFADQVSFASVNECAHFWTRQPLRTIFGRLETYQKLELAVHSSVENFLGLRCNTSQFIVELVRRKFDQTSAT